MPEVTPGTLREGDYDVTQHAGACQTCVPHLVARSRRRRPSWGGLLGELRQPDGLGRVRGPSKSRCAARNKVAFQRVSTLQPSPSLVSTSARRLRRLVSQGSHTLQADELKCSRAERLQQITSLTQAATQPSSDLT